ncbi:hypothetical protein [Bacillus thuringiensis]|uniref:Uncharacterized protein n=1 Tax=Bacillus thuringiensis TaxID=1428 RepID=A0AAW9JAX6_BACTU|nr:hypothetical protein [Bacillus thuringiensis]MDZ5479154.1 hypothetical protein [Bacillus thuringiensis]
MQITRLLQPATINWCINSIERYFDRARQTGMVQTNYSKSINVVLAEKTSPKRMSDKEAAVLMNIIEEYVKLSDKTILSLCFILGLILWSVVIFK